MLAVLSVVFLVIGGIHAHQIESEYQAMQGPKVTLEDSQ